MTHGCAQNDYTPLDYKLERIAASEKWSMPRGTAATQPNSTQPRFHRKRPSARPRGSTCPAVEWNHNSSVTNGGIERVGSKCTAVCIDRVASVRLLWTTCKSLPP